MSLLRSILRPSVSIIAARHITDPLVADTVVKTCLQRVTFVPVTSFWASSRLFSTSSLTPELKSKLDEAVKKDKVVVFMKGVPDAPKCGFSNAVVQVS